MTNTVFSSTSNFIKVVCGGNEIRSVITNILNSKTIPNRIRIISYSLENVKISDGLKLEDLLSKLAMRGATISIVIGQMPAKKVKRVLVNLNKMGINVYYNRRAHAKIILVEGIENYAIIMTANVTHGGLYYNYEAGILMRLSEDIHRKIRDYTNNIIGSEETEDMVNMYE